MIQSSSIADDNEGSKFEMIMHHGIKLVSCADSVLKKIVSMIKGLGEGLSPPKPARKLRLWRHFAHCRRATNNE